MRLVQQHGNKNWRFIAAHLPGRLAKQCRERWFNQLDPSVKRVSLSEEEWNILVEAHEKYGNHWAEIVKSGKLPGRTANQLKNHWNTRVRRRSAAKPKKRAHDQDQSDLPQAKRVKYDSDTYESDGESETELTPALLSRVATSSNAHPNIKTGAADLSSLSAGANKLSSPNLQNSNQILEFELRRQLLMQQQQRQQQQQLLTMLSFPPVQQQLLARQMMLQQQLVASKLLGMDMMQFQPYQQLRLQQLHQQQQQQHWMGLLGQHQNAVPGFPLQTMPTTSHTTHLSANMLAVPVEPSQSKQNVTLSSPDEKMKSN